MPRPARGLLPGELPLFHRAGELPQPLGEALAVEDGLAQNAPLPQAVHGVVVGVGVPVALQGLAVGLIQEGVVPVGGLNHQGPGVRLVEKAGFQPVLGGDGVEGEHHLLGGGTAPQAHVQLVEVRLADLGGLLHPDVGELPLGEGDGLQLLPVVQPLEHRHVPVFAGDAQVCLPAGEQLGDAPLGHDLAEQGVGAVPVGGGHRPHHQQVAQGPGQEPVQEPLGGEHAFAAARPAVEHQVPVVLLPEEGVEFGGEHLLG